MEEDSQKGQRLEIIKWCPFYDKVLLIRSQN